MKKDIRQFNEIGYRHGYWEIYWSNGKVYSKGNYHNGKKHGYWEYYNFDGNIDCKGHYDNGNRIGYWECYLYDGKLIEQIFYS
jgi:antitoxin component YwqK of YwqJK toxin-antitoxin module